MSANIFSYGTLQSESVQLNTFGKALEGDLDLLTGFKSGLIKIGDEAVIAKSGMTHYQNIFYSGNPSDTISGMVFMITETELKQADKYEESADYKRIPVKLQSGKTAWVYVSSTSIISGQP